MKRLSNEVIRQAAAYLGSLGGKTAAARMTAKQRRERARKGGLANAKPRTDSRTPCGKDT